MTEAHNVNNYALNTCAGHAGMTFKTCGVCSEVRRRGSPTARPLSQQRLEQLRALDNGIPIAVARVDYQAVGVDVPEDVARVEALLEEKGE